MKLFAYHNHPRITQKNMLLDCVMAFDKWELFLILRDFSRQLFFQTSHIVYAISCSYNVCKYNLALFNIHKCGFYFYPRFESRLRAKSSQKINTFNLISKAYFLIVVLQVSSCSREGVKCALQ